MALSLSREQCDRLVNALEIKLASLKRAMKGAQPNFQVVYEQEVSEYNRLVDHVRSAVDGNAKANPKG